MIVTEKQAAEKWCPHVRHLELSEDADGRVVSSAAVNAPDEHGESRCIGSGCMSWRDGWRSTKGDVGAVMFGVTHPPSSDWERVGYCGLAGKP